MSLFLYSKGQYKNILNSSQGSAKLRTWGGLEKRELGNWAGSSALWPCG